MGLKESIKYLSHIDLSLISMDLFVVVLVIGLTDIVNFFLQFLGSSWQARWQPTTRVCMIDVTTCTCCMPAAPLGFFQPAIFGGKTINIRAKPLDFGQAFFSAWYKNRCRSPPPPPPHTLEKIFRQIYVTAPLQMKLVPYAYAFDPQFYNSIPLKFTWKYTNIVGEILKIQIL